MRHRGVGAPTSDTLVGASGLNYEGENLKLQNQGAEFGAEFCQILVFFIQKHQDCKADSDGEK